MPVVVLVWCLTVERFSPQLSAFWATVFMVFIVITQRPLQAFFRHQGAYGRAIRNGWSELLHAMAVGCLPSTWRANYYLAKQHHPITNLALSA